ncbi:MAG: hypothetical protein HY077_19150 [Elusimicrobia bacterium]|nr:hypothetical protein [Elusimicrobiota bacterium]
MRRLGTLAAATAFLLSAVSLSAGPPMGSASNTLYRNAVDAGTGDFTATANNSLTAGVGEEVVGPKMNSASYDLYSAAFNLFSFPNTVADFAAHADQTTSSVTFQWSTPGYDGTLGAALQTGSFYAITIASYTSPDIFASVPNAQTIVSTGPTGTGQGAVVFAGATSLIPNTTYFAELWALDAAGNVGFASNRSTFTSLANAPAKLSNFVLNVFYTSATLAWAALADFPPDASSKTSEGYTLEASLSNFGAIVASSVTYNVRASTLTMASLDMENTYYFRVGSYNWASQPNYTNLGKINLQIIGNIGTLSFGTIDPNITNSLISASPMVVTNVGNIPVTLQLFSNMVTQPSSPWVLAASSAPDVPVLQGVFNTASPAQTAFNTALTGSTVTADASLYRGDTTGVAVPVAESRSLWFQFWRPTSTTSTAKETMRVELRPIYP